MKATALALLALTASSSAFAPASQKSVQTPTQPAAPVNTESRREALGFIGAAIGGLVLPGVSNASNPALQTFKGGKKTKGAFIPGKVRAPI
jgi:hypothetical protein